MKVNMKTKFLLGLFIAPVLLSGCSSIPLGTPQASMENVSKLRNANLAPAQLGNFALAAGKSADVDKVMSVRTNRVMSPVGDSFSLYIKELLAVELKAAGLLDSSSSVVIRGELRDTQLDAAIGTGTGSIEAKFEVVRDGKSNYQRVIKVDASWPSSFIGAVAIPDAVNNYSALFRKLITTLIDDAEFKAALAK